MAEKVAAMGVTVPYPENHWYGEPAASQRREFMLQAKLMDLDKLTDPSSSEPLSERFWRRYGTAPLACWSVSGKMSHALDC